jgi:ABC-type multidrug transport system fused ATPase/permease subunit
VCWRRDAALHQAQQRLATVRGLANALTALVTGLAGLTMLWLAIPLVTAGQLEGVYLALLPLTAMAAFECVQPLGQAWQMLESSEAAARRIFELIEAEPAVTDQPTSPIYPSGHLPQPGLSIEVHSLRFRYTADQPLVLDGLTFSVPAGGRVAIVGPNGSGKSSLVNVLLRFWDYEAGTIRIGGRDLRQMPADEARSLLAVVPQHTHLFNATIRDNLYLANPDASDDELIAACQQALLHDFVQSLPQGYDTLIGENGLLLSGGERQRLAIARAILKDAPILVLDEATSQLDAVTEQQLLQSLENFMARRTTLVISHRRAGLTGVSRIDLDTSASPDYI